METVKTAEEQAAEAIAAAAKTAARDAVKAAILKAADNADLVPEHRAVIKSSASVLAAALIEEMPGPAAQE